MRSRRTLFFALIVCPCVAGAIYLLDPRQQPKTVDGWLVVTVSGIAVYVVITYLLACRRRAKTAR